MRITALIIALACTSAFAQEKRARRPAYAAELASERVEIPLDHSNGHANVPVTIDGKGPYRFQFDTYASIHATIDDDLAEELGLEVIGQIPNSDGNQVVMRDMVWIDELEMGGVRLRNVRALVDDYDFVPALGGSLQGLVGFPALKDHLVTFDYPGDRIVVEEGSLDPDAPGTLPIRLTTGSPDILLEMGGESVVVGIDTGSSSSLFLDVSIAERLGISELTKVGQARTVYSTRDILRGVLPSPIDLAGFELQPPVANFIPFPTARGLLGYKVLRSFAVTFDGEHRLVRFERPQLPIGIDLSAAQLETWVGRYQVDDRLYVIERVGDALFLSEDSMPPLATIALSPEELRLVSAPVWFALVPVEGDAAQLHVLEHPALDPRIAVRID